MGIIILQRRYALSKYLAVLMITIGILICTIVSGSDIVSEFIRGFMWPQTRIDFFRPFEWFDLSTNNYWLLILEKYSESRAGKRCSCRWIFRVLLVVVWHISTCYRLVDLSTNGNLSRSFVQTPWQACTWSSLRHCKFRFSLNFVSFDLKCSIG